MKQSLIISSVMSKISLPKTKLENDINKRNNRGKLSFVDILLPGFENISWQFLNTAVSGDVEIVFANKQNNKITRLDVPVTTGFLAGCTKGNQGSYKLAFGISLS